MKKCYSVLAILCLMTVCFASPANSQDRIERRSENRVLPSLREAAAEARARGPRFIDRIYQVPNKPLRGDLRTQQSELNVTDPLVQPLMGAGTTNLLSNFEGASNEDNRTVLGFRVSPPDTDGDVGPSHYVQMINLVTTIFDKNGNILEAPFPTNAIWQGAGGLCEAFNQGDPIVLYDETNDRWLVSQFAFDDAFVNFAQCVAISQTGDPTGAFNRYEFDFNSIGFPDYPKHGITTESITMMANVFAAQGPFFRFQGTFIGVMDKNAMYSGSPATLVGFNLGQNEFGFVAGDLDDETGAAGFVPALFATAMSNSAQFDVWQIDIDWANAGGASANRVAEIPVSPFDTDLCSASREACIPQPDVAQQLEALSDRLMHRLQIRDFGSYNTMVASHTVDVGNGRAGIRWYELRKPNDGVSGWSLYQEGTYAPDDGKYRWVPSIAMNGAGDIGLGYLLSDGTGTYMSVGLAGQSAGQSGTNMLDASETICKAGSGAQTESARAGDYSATKVDPVSGAFWHTNEYVQTTGVVTWMTQVCEFSVTGGTGGTPPPAPSDLVANAVSSSQIDLSWTDNALNEDYFEIEQSLDNVNFTSIGTTGTDVTSFSDVGLTASTEYFYQVRACNIDGCSAYSNVASATTQSDGGGVATSVHVASLILDTQNVGKGNKKGRATVVVEDNLGNPASSYTVTGDFSGDYNETQSGLTDGSGQAEILTDATLRGGVSFSFCVSGIELQGGGGLPYDPRDDADPSYACPGVPVPSVASSSQPSQQLIAGVPGSFSLKANYPNPFNPVTTIRFLMPETAQVRLTVYDMLGREVETLVDGVRDAGTHEVRFEAGDLPSGTYLYRLETPQGTFTNKMMLLK